MATATTLAYETNFIKQYAALKLAFLSFYLGAGVCYESRKAVPQEMAICFLHRYASMQAALLPQGTQTKASIIQANYMVLCYGMCCDRAYVLLKGGWEQLFYAMGNPLVQHLQMGLNKWS